SLRIRSPPSYTLFPYATLFRSLQGIGATSEKVLPCLAITCLHIGIVAVGQDGHEHFHFFDLPGGTVHELELFASKVDEQLLAGRSESTRLNSSHVKISYAVFCL